jgi:PKHD-type hydroxylase
MTPIAWKLRSTEQIHKFVTVDSVFSNEEIDLIKQHAVTLEEKPPFVSTLDPNMPNKINNSIRQCQVKWIEPVEECKWLFQRLVDVIQKVNGEVFNFNLYGIQSLQYTIYKEEDQGFYSPHRDAKITADNGFVRKLSFSLQLTDPSEYEGGKLILDTEFDEKTASKNFGSINFFPSDLLHEVKPVTKGCRHVLVGWVVGPPLV